MTRLHFVPIGMIVALAACRSAAPPELPAEPFAGFPLTRAGPDCAPWDGAAMTLLFSAESPHPDSIRPPYLRVSLWKDLDSLVGHTWRWPAAVRNA